jgi:signal transduction histidine kinase/DNA-binding response OmpR family regulator/HPt (histidine-containing phosphotransfer) domain-containing protein
MPTRLAKEHDLHALAGIVAASTDSIMRRLTESEKFLQRVETVSRVGGFMFEFASGEYQWTRQAFRIHEIDEDCRPTRELVDSFLAPAARERLHEANRIARETGIGYDIEIPLVTAKRRAIWVRVAAEVESENGVPVRIVGAIQDITERCKLEHRLRDAIANADKASKSKSEFLANMSHEIRTPLNAVIGLSYLLEQTSLSEDQRQFLSKIQFAGRALLGVVNNVLDLSKIEAGEMSLEDQPFELIELVRDVSQMLLPQAVEKGIELMIRPAPDALPRMVMGDALRVRQILTNLLNNAIKFTERGRVTLAAFCTERGAGRIRLRCEVADTGIGIEAGACERLFTPFTQADASTTRRFGGTGLGLSIARRFVELMGGEIGVTSTPGTGSTFWIELPLRTAPDVGGSITTNGLRILVLDSHGDTPQGQGAMVRALGWSPQVVETAEQLVSVMNDPQQNAQPDALIMDLHDRGAEVHALIAQIEGSSACGEMPAVMVVAESEQSYLSHKQLMRPSDVLLIRPVTSSALFNAINLAMSRRPEINERVFVSTNFDELHAQWLCGVQVLVVDGGASKLEVAQRILEKQGAVVTTCSDGPSALAHLRTRRKHVDLVLMDVQMPALDGNEVTRRIRRELRLDALPIVALTAGALVGERQRSLDAGMNDFVSKPFDPQVLIRKVRRLVELARGEPIPMVFDDTKPVSQSGTGLFLRSVDAGVVQQMFGDDLALFKSLLARMLRDFSDLSLPITMSSDDREARRLLEDRAHKLKGSAGMIGATSVMRYAGAVERALQESRAPDAVEGILKKLAAALTTLKDEAKVMLQEAPLKTASVRGDAPNDPCIDTADLDELRSLLECQNLAAVDKYALMSPRLAELLGAAQFERLREAVENLDFQIAAELLPGRAAGFLQPKATAA